MPGTTHLQDTPPVSHPCSCRARASVHRVSPTCLLRYYRVMQSPWPGRLCRVLDEHTSNDQRSHCPAVFQLMAQFYDSCNQQFIEQSWPELLCCSWHPQPKSLGRTSASSWNTLQPASRICEIRDGHCVHAVANWSASNLLPGANPPSYSIPCHGSGISKDSLTAMRITKETQSQVQTS